MDLTRYKTVHSTHFLEALDKACNGTITDYQKEKIRDAFLYNNFPYEVVQYQGRDSKTTFFGRLSMPLVAITLLLIRFTIMPIKYIITGDSYFKHDSKMLKFMRYLDDKSGLGWV